MDFYTQAHTQTDIYIYIHISTLMCAYLYTPSTHIERRASGCAHTGKQWHIRSHLGCRSTSKLKHTHTHDIYIYKTYTHDMYVYITYTHDMYIYIYIHIYIHTYVSVYTHTHP